MDDAEASARADQTRAWIEAVLGKGLGESSLQEELKDGVVLCNLMNAIKPDSCSKPSSSKMPFKQMENVAAYLTACKDLGLRPFEMFMTVRPPLTFTPSPAALVPWVCAAANLL
jgi:hypothetical protein